MSYDTKDIMSTADWLKKKFEPISNRRFKPLNRKFKTAFIAKQQAIQERIKPELFWDSSNGRTYRRPEPKGSR
jgi:hypothetical protein